MKTQLEKFVESRIESLEKRLRRLEKMIESDGFDFEYTNDLKKEIQDIEQHISDLRTCSTLEVKSK